MPQTTDSGAKKILGTDNWRGIFDIHNDTVDAYDGQIAGLQDGLAIVANGNTHAAIASGQFVYVKNHGSLATGLYKARAVIGANVTLSTSNLAADSAGGLNDLQGQVDSLNSNMTKIIMSESLSVPKSGSATVTLPNKTGSFLCAWRGTNAVWRGLALICKTSTNDGTCTILFSNMSSASESGNVLTFTNQHSDTDQIYYIRVTEIGQ